MDIDIFRGACILTGDRRLETGYRRENRRLETGDRRHDKTLIP
jgi:hypothetical protein